MTTSVASARLEKLRGETHRHCIVCSPCNPQGLGVRFEMRRDGSVEAEFGSCEIHEGYTGYLHGGVIASLLDGAMTNCLFAHGTIAFTADLSVRFKKPVRIGATAKVRAWIEKSNRSMHVVKAELTQMGEVRATSRGKFLEKMSVQSRDSLPTGGPSPERR